MKDQLTALTEAVRLAQLELSCFRDPHFRGTPEWTIRRLETLLGDPKVAEAMATFAPESDSPSLVPDWPERETIKH